MARDASLVPITTASSAVEAEGDIYVWFVRLFKTYVTGRQVKWNLSCVFLFIVTKLSWITEDKITESLLVLL